MSIVQFLRIFWARRLIILAATLSCLFAAVIVGLVLPPRWQAHSRVLLNEVKPDPVTGLTVSGGDLRGYVATQLELVKDYAVAGQVADQLGWLTDPVLIERYQGRPKRDVRDFRRWVAQLVTDNTKTSVVEGSNILDITYTATTPAGAKAVADALRTAYVDTSLAFARQDATRNAEWFGAQAQQAKTALDAAETAETTFERENGLVMQDNKLDVDSARLQALAGTGVVPAAPVYNSPSSSPESSALAVELAQTDAAIAEDAKTLGPNHPELLQLRAKRTAMAAELAKQRAAGGGAVATADLGALDRAVGAQKAKVIAQGDKIARLKQLRSEVDLRRDQYEKTAAKAVEFHEDAGRADVGLTPLGGAVVPKDPAFPNWPLILAGAVALGLAVGVLVALLVELFGRRVRGPEDLQASVDAPLLAILAPPPGARQDSLATLTAIWSGGRGPGRGRMARA